MSSAPDATREPAQAKPLAARKPRRRIGRGPLAVVTEPVADGVWVVRGGFPKKAMNAFLIEDGDGVTVFDAAISDMAKGILAAASDLGGIKRVVLGHAHPDHRGAAPKLGAPVLCHSDEVAEAEGDGGQHYYDLSKLPAFRPGLLMSPRVVLPLLIKHWDGGPVKIADSLSEGDEIAGFKVVHTPGHAPGQISLWRESDRLVLASDTVYTLDSETGVYGEPRLAHPAFTPDRDMARASLRKIAALEPAAVWPSHADPVRGADVRARLERAADTT